MAEAGPEEGIVEGAGVVLRRVTRGAAGAPVVLLVHGIAADADALAPAAEALAGRGARVVTYDRRGYGGSGAPEPYGATTVHEQAEDAAAVLRAVADATPAVVAGDGFGALVALDVAMRHGSLVRALALVDPPLLQLVPEAAEALSSERAMLEDALREGGPQLAVARWLGSRADEAGLRRAQAAHVAFFADLAGVTSWPVTRRGLRGVGVPSAVAVSEGAQAHVARAGAALRGLLPEARRVDGGTLADAVAAVL